MRFLSRLDPNFFPIHLALKEYEDKAVNGKAFYIAIGRENNQFYTIDTKIINPMSQETIKYIERLIKSALYVVGGYSIYLAGDNNLAETIATIFAPNGARAFDVDFMTKVYSRPFEVNIVEVDKMPKATKNTVKIGGNSNGCRIGFDAGGSDRKVSAVMDGKVLYSEEIVWYPKLQSDPNYHYNEIVTAMKTAASYLPRVDGIGVSTAGVVIDNNIKIASLFLKVNEEDFKKYAEGMYVRAAKSIADVPVIVANDGDVTALAGAIQLESNGVLGIAMGTSEATGYFNMEGGLNGWLNELAFVPVDYNEMSMADEWSGDYGCGVKYFSQDSVIKLAEVQNIVLDGSPAQKLKAVQELMANDDTRAIEIYQTIGTYLGYTLPFYSRFYEINYVLLLGRVMSGKGGDLIITQCEKVLKEEFPELRIKLATPDEYTRRVGQAVIAASLPVVK